MKGYIYSSLTLTEKQKHKLRNVLAVLNANRAKFYEQRQEKHKQELIQKAKCKFRPTVLPKSAKLAQIVRKKTNVFSKKTKVHDYLLEKGKETKNKTIHIKIQKDSEELQGCTFK